MSTPTLWRRSPKAWMKAALTARLPCCLCCWPDPPDCECEAAEEPWECPWPWLWPWPWPWPWRWPPWFNRKPILNHKKTKKWGFDLINISPILDNALDWTDIIASGIRVFFSCRCIVKSSQFSLNSNISPTYIRLTATPTAAVMSMTSPFMLKSWCTVLCTAS